MPPNEPGVAKRPRVPGVVSPRMRQVIGRDGLASDSVRNLDAQERVVCRQILAIDFHVDQHLEECRCRIGRAIHDTSPLAVPPTRGVQTAAPVECPVDADAPDDQSAKMPCSI